MNHKQGGLAGKSEAGSLDTDVVGSSTQSNKSARTAQAALEHAEQMMDLFPCDTRSHATYDASKQTKLADGKVDVGYRTVRAPVTAELWQQHIAGTYPLVIGLGCEDGTGSVFCLDVDNDPGSALDLVAKIAKLGMPLYVHRTKSDGAHVLGFVDERMPIKKLREVAGGLARRLDLRDDDVAGEVEIFPEAAERGPDGSAEAAEHAVSGRQVRHHAPRGRRRHADRRVSQVLRAKAHGRERQDAARE